MILLASFNRRTRQRARNTVRYTLEVAALDQELLHMLHRTAAHPLLDQDRRRLCGRVNGERSHRRKESARRQTAAEMLSFPQFTCRPKNTFCC